MCKECGNEGRFCGTDTPAKPPKLASRLELFVKWLKRGMEYCFKRRLAIKPEQYYITSSTTGYPQKDYSKMLFAWQKMPRGYRWF